MDGRIRLSGTLNGNGKTAVDISALSKGKYQLFIINQGLIVKKLISLDS
jgi:predicted ABC-type ATPase